MGRRFIWRRSRGPGAEALPSLAALRGAEAPLFHGTPSALLSPHFRGTIPNFYSFAAIPRDFILR